jgi:NADPH:quinone reductase-like Zn-dependent oxidoreductase
MRALILHELKQPLREEERADLEPASNQVVVQLKAAALNRRDYWITQGMYPGIKLPVILGSDGAGVVTRLGDGVDDEWVGREVIINPGWNWGDATTAQASTFEILGMPNDGTFSTELVVPASYLHGKPTHLDWRQAAALPLGGVTAFRALFTQGRLQAGERVLISGVGGGVATFALQYAVAAGATVFVTSSSDEKIAQAIQLGATAGYHYTLDGWPKSLKAEHAAPDLIIDSAGGAGFADLIDLIAPGGRIVNYGVTAGPPQKVDLFKVFWKQLHLIGSTMGSPDDFAAMLDFVNRHQLTPAVDRVLPLGEANEALEWMKSSKQFGKLVLDCEA